MNQLKSLNLDSSINEVRHIGYKRARALNSMSIYSVEDLLCYIPRTYLDRSTLRTIDSLKAEEYVTISGRVIWVKQHFKRLSVGFSDNTGTLNLCWFRGTDYLKNKFARGAMLIISGRVGMFRGTLQMVHPEFELVGDESQPVPPGIMPIYPMTENLRRSHFDSRNFQRAMRDCLERLSASLPERLPEVLRNKNKLPQLKETFRYIHFPEKIESVFWYLNRLKYEEIFFFLLKMAELRKRNELTGKSLVMAQELELEVRNRIPFKLTNAQEKVLEEIKSDLGKEKVMHRLLQGDVGSGKTVVVALAMLNVVQAGLQVAIMAPTEILALQHYEGLKALLEPSGITIVLLTGGITGKIREKTDLAVKSGEAQVAVGTHALVSRTTCFNDLGMVIIDEQHRFGVHQRFALAEKSKNPDMLVISATPIPRTLAMTLYGDLDISVIDEMPPGRIPVKTHLVSENKRGKMYEFLRQRIAENNQVFVILPMISESEKMDEIKSATQMETYLKRGPLKKARISLIHGRLKPAEKENIMRSFKAREFDVLVSTTVVEVGVDIPHANIMIIENAERFGFSQLHQLRGRVGRGGGEPFCFLLPGREAKEESMERLKMFCSTNDGFKIAEMDFAMRGPGEMSGLRQSGMPEFRFIHLLRDRKLIAKAKEDAESLAAGGIMVTDREREILKKGLAEFDHIREKLLQTG
ncbi:MAG: ATP-dependent DNA helicase RecG [bacterium]